MPWRRLLTVGILLAGIGWMVWLKGCDAPLPDIEVTDGSIVVRNQSETQWRDVRVWVNEYYAVTVTTIPPAGFIRERVSRFVAAQGQTINTSTTPVTSVVVLATAPDGSRVRLTWGRPQLH